MNNLKDLERVIEKVLDIEFMVEELGYHEDEAIKVVGLTEDEYRAGYRALNEVRIPEDELVEDFLRVDDEVFDDDYTPCQNPLTYADYLTERGYSDEQVSELVADYFGWNE